MLILPHAFAKVQSASGIVPGEAPCRTSLYESEVRKFTERKGVNLYDHLGADRCIVDVRADVDAGED